MKMKFKGFIYWSHGWGSSQVHKFPGNCRSQKYNPLSEKLQFFGKLLTSEFDGYEFDPTSTDVRMIRCMIVRSIGFRFGFKPKYTIATIICFVNPYILIFVKTIFSEANFFVEPKGRFSIDFLLKLPMLREKLKHNVTPQGTTTPITLMQIIS